jgi:regulator of protease activity HflC (stomatin/prohibitin superfamily)
MTFLFERKDDIAIAVKRELNEAMITYGYTIINTLVTDIDPDIQVKNAMNRINAADREKQWPNLKQKHLELES